MSAEIPWATGPGESWTQARRGPAAAPSAASAVEAQSASEPDPALLALTCEAVLQAVCAQRDRALLDLQAARSAVAYWRAKAEGR